MTCIRVFRQVLNDKLGMSIKQKICLLIVAFMLVNLGLDRAHTVKYARGKIVERRTSFSRVPAVLNQYFSAMSGLYS